MRQSFNKIEKFFFKKSKMIFSINIISALFWIGLCLKIIYSCQKYLFWGYSKWQKIKQNAPCFNSDRSLIFCHLRSSNHVKLTEECVLCTKEHVLANNGLKLARLFKEGENSFQDEDWLNRPLIKDISLLRISVTAVLKTVHNILTLKLTLLSWGDKLEMK